MLIFVVRARSVLEPDFARYYPESIGKLGNKQAEDLLWVVEISVTSLAKALGAKKAAYAASGVPDYCIIDVENRTIRMFSKPLEGSYTKERKARRARRSRSRTSMRRWTRIDFSRPERRIRS